MIGILGSWNDGQQLHETEANIPIFSTSPGLNFTDLNPFGMEPEIDHSARLHLRCITRNCDADLFGSSPNRGLRCFSTPLRRDSDMGPDTMILQGGTNLCGILIGILCLETYYGKPPGHIRNASTFRFPVMYRIVKGATAMRVVKEADPALLDPFIKSAQKLEQEGVMAITGSCGFLAFFQGELADSVNIPVFSSSLIQIPMVYRMLHRNRKVGILTASKSTLTEAHLKSVGAETVPVCVAGMDDQKEFCEVVIEGRRNELDLERLGEEVLTVVQRMAEDHPEMGALVIECTDLPPFAHLIQEKIRVPVFDIVTLTNMVYETLMRTPYQGILPRRADDRSSLEPY